MLTKSQKETDGEKGIGSDLTVMKHFKT